MFCIQIKTTMKPLFNGYLKKKFYQIGWKLQFRLSPSLFGHRVTLYTNHPKEEGQTLDRTAYHKLQWQSDSKNRDDDTATFIDVTLVQAGPFHFYFTCEDRQVYYAWVLI